VFLDENDPDKVVYHSQYSLIKTDDGFATSYSIKPNPISGLINDFILLENGNYGLMANTFFYSADEGQTWTETETENLNGLDLFEMDGALFTGFRAIMRSTNGGITFDTVFNSTDIKRKFVNLNGKPVLSSLSELYTSHDMGLTWEVIPAIDFYGSADNLIAHNGRLLANSSNRINYSDDEGITWTSVIMPVGIYRTGCIYVDDLGTIFIGGEASQIYVTDDPNNPLQVRFGEKDELNSIVSRGLKVAAAGNSGVLLTSEDGGQSWTKTTVADRNLEVGGFIGTKLFVASENQELLLVNGDHTTTPVLTYSTYPHSFVDAGDAQTAYFGTAFKVYYTDDAGQTWSDRYTHPIEISKMHFMDNDRIAFLDQTGHLYSSQDQGSQFQIFSASPDTNEYYLDFTVFDDMHFIVMSSSTLYKTEDGGATWTSDYRPYNGLRLFQMDDKSALCLGVNASDGWLYKTDNQGSTFPSIAQTCSTISRSAYYDSETQTFWVAGSGLVIQKVQFEITSSRETSVNFASMQVYPNPAIDMINFKTDIPYFTSIAVYDMMGARIRNTHGSIQSLDISTLVPGPYQIIMQEGNQLWTSRFVKQ
jgi:photosystem II stability/assembly factor-like uncharacterized protein